MSSTSGGSELYVYYRVQASQAAAAQAEIQALQHALMQALPGLQARLLTRTDGSDGSDTLTWMESYCSAQGLSGSAIALIEARAAASPTGRVGPRHPERFSPIDAR